MMTRGSVAAMAAMKSEIEDALKSEAFQQLLQSAIQEALNVAVLKIIEPMTKTIAELQEKITSLESQLVRVENMANDNEQYSRRHNVRISGFEEERIEDCITKVVQFCNEKLKVDLSDQNIDRAHRVGKPKENRSRAIIVRFKSHKDKIAVLRQRKELKSTRFYVNEDLTSRNQQLLYCARKDCKNAASAWSRDGKIFVKRASDEKIFKIVSMSDFLQNDLLNFAY
jgi:precorrin-6B methylase 1